MSLKVFHIFPAYKIGGAPINTLRYIKNDKKYQHYTVGKAIDKKFYQEYQKYTEACFDVNLTNFSINSIYQLIKILNKIKPDIIHCKGKGGALYGFLLRLLSFKRFKIFYTFHGFHLKYKGINLKLYLLFELLFSKLFNKGIAVSNSERDFYLLKTKVNSKKIVVIPNGIEINKQKLSSQIKDITAKYKFNIIYLARINYQKDLITMFNSFDELNKKDIALHIMGGYINNDLPYKNKINNLYNNLKTKDNIYLWGDVEKAHNLIHNFDIYWSTALTEGLPSAIIEAMMSKVLVVGTNCCGNVDLIQDEQTGLITQIRDIKSNVTKINQAIELIEKNQTDKIITNAYKFVQQFTIANYIKNIDQLYQLNNYE